MGWLIEESLIDGVSKALRDCYEAYKEGRPDDLPLYGLIKKFNAKTEKAIAATRGDKTEVGESEEVLKVCSVLQTMGVPIAVAAGKMFRAIVGPEKFETIAKEAWEMIADSWNRAVLDELSENVVRSAAGDYRVTLVRFQNKMQVKKMMLSLAEEYGNGFHAEAIHLYPEEYAEVLKVVSEVRNRAFPEQSGRAEEVLMDIATPMIQRLVSSVRRGRTGIVVGTKAKAIMERMPEALIALWPETVVRNGIMSEVLGVLLTKGRHSSEDYFVRIREDVSPEDLMCMVREYLGTIVKTKGSVPPWSAFGKDSIYQRNGMLEEETTLLAKADTRANTITVGLSDRGLGSVKAEVNCEALTHADYARIRACLKRLMCTIVDRLSAQLQPVQMAALLYENLNKSLTVRTQLVAGQLLRSNTGKDKAEGALFIETPASPEMSGAGASVLDVSSETCPDLFVDIAYDMGKLQVNLLLSQLDDFASYSEKITETLRKQGDEVGSKAGEVLHVVKLPATGIVPDMEFAISLYDLVDFGGELSGKLVKLAEEALKENNPRKAKEKFDNATMDTVIELGMFLVKKNGVLLDEPRRVSLKFTLKEMLESDVGASVMKRVMEVSHGLFKSDRSGDKDRVVVEVIEDFSRFAGNLIAFVETPQVKEKLYNAAAQMILRELCEEFDEDRAEQLKNP